MSLYSLRREYEERRQNLVDQLKENPNTDPSTQHQIYGAIKEIENFLETIDSRLSESQEKDGIDLLRERPKPLVEKTKKIAGKVRSGTQKVAGTMKKHAKKVKNVHKKYREKRRLKKKLKKELEREMLQRMQHDAAEAGKLPDHIKEKEHHDSLPPISSGKLEPETSGKSELQKDEPREEVAPPEPKPRKAPEKPAKKSKKKSKKKSSKKKAKKSGSKKSKKKSSKKSSGKAKKKGSKKKSKK